jgi:hypothetical protein
VTQSANGNTNSNLTNITNNNGASTAPLVTPLNNNILNNDTSQPNPTDEKKSTPVSNRAKPISCLTFSPDGHYLAAGEVGISSDPNPIYKKKTNDSLYKINHYRWAINREFSFGTSGKRSFFENSDHTSLVFFHYRFLQTCDI